MSAVEEVAAEIGRTPDAHKDAITILDGVALFLCRRYGPRFAAQVFYSHADFWACTPDNGDRP